MPGSFSDIFNFSNNYSLYNPSQNSHTIASIEFTDKFLCDKKHLSCVCDRPCTNVLGLKRMVILVFKYSLGFQTNIPNILFTRRSDKMAILSDKITIILVE